MLRQMIVQEGGRYRLPYPAAAWEEGLLLGNGTLGAVAFGAVRDERILFTHERLFAPVGENPQPISMADSLEKIRGLIAEGKCTEAAQIAFDLFRQKEGKEEKIWTRPFFPAGELHIFTEGCSVYEDYERSLDFAKGEARVSFAVNGALSGEKRGESPRIQYGRRYMAVREADTCAVLLTADAPVSYEIELIQTPYVKNGMHVNRPLFAAAGGEDFLRARTEVLDGGLRYLCHYSGRKDGYAVLARVFQADGARKLLRERLRISECSEALILVSVVLLTEDDNWEETLRREEERLDLLAAFGPAEGWRGLQKLQEQLHKSRYDRISLTLPDKHLETMFYAGRYEILSSCGEFPPNLQGVWTGTYDTPWSSDYTQNGNLQTAILGLLPCGDFEGMESYFRYQEAMLEDYRTNSRILYGCRGIHIPSRTSDCGLDFHFDMTWPMVFWTAGAGWAAHFYYDYWLYTCDDAFFMSRALPFMKEAALFYEDFLTEDENGYWRFSPSYSPENTPLGRDNAACANAAMDLAVAKELFRNLITGCRTLDCEEASVKRWEAFLEKMPPYLINEEGALKEWAAPAFADRYDHRHSSHLYMLYYGLPDEPEEVLAAARRAYELKMERKKEEKGTMAFGLVQAGMAAAHLGDGEMAGMMLASMAENNYYRTYASSHDYGPSIFNADISGGVPALMLECLAQCMPVTDETRRITGYEVRLLPALPASMQSGRVQGMRLRGGLSLDMEWENGKVKDWKIISLCGKTYFVKA